MFRSPDPQGPWQYIGDFKDEKGNKILRFDPMAFVDDDRRVYMQEGRSERWGGFHDYPSAWMRIRNIHVPVLVRRQWLVKAGALL